MENILQSLVKIIIIGAVTRVHCNRQFLPPPPPLPYYQNEHYYYVPPFPSAFRNPLPYYPDRTLPSPTSFQNLNSFAPPQLFYQNDDYVPPPARLTYAPANPLPYNQPPQPQKPQQKLNVLFSRVQYKSSPPAQPPRPQQQSQKKTEAFASNIIVKEEPLYSDDYGKNYNDEDYGDSYSDDVASPGKPCSRKDPYRYFEAPNREEGPLCNPYFQPNFGSSVYTLKVPITLLPSRFPPRVEQLIERIQNYFSTYTHQQTSKPANEIVVTSTVPPAVETSSESAVTSTTAEEHTPSNLLVEQESTTGNKVEEMVERTTTEAKELSTAAPEVEVKEEQTIRTVEAATEQAAEISKPMEDTESVQNMIPQELQSMHNSSEPNMGAFEAPVSNSS